MSLAETALLEGRSEAYRILFDDSSGALSSEQLTLPQEALALTALTRHVTPKTVPVVGQSSIYREGVYLEVHDVLTRHQQNALQGSTAIFSIRSEETLSQVASMTARVICRWQAVCRKARQESPFNIDREERGSEANCSMKSRLVIETAAGILAALQVFPSKAKDTKWAESLVSRFGPDYALRWINGTRAREVLGGDRNAKRHFLRYLTPTDLRRLANRCGSEPERVLEERALIVTRDLSTRSIARKLRWPPERVKTFFTPDIKMRLALTSPDSATKKALDYKRQLEELTDFKLMREFGLSRGQITEFVNFSLKRYAIIRNPRDPLTKVGETVLIASELAREYELPSRICLELAKFMPKNARERAAQIRERMKLLPASVSPGLAAWTAHHYPELDAESQAQHISATQWRWAMRQAQALTPRYDEPQPFRPFADQQDRFMHLVLTPAEEPQVIAIEALGASFEVYSTDVITNAHGEEVKLSERDKMTLLLLSLGGSVGDIEAYCMDPPEVSALLRRLGFEGVNKVRDLSGYARAVYLTCRELLDPITLPDQAFPRPEIPWLKDYLEGNISPVNARDIRRKVDLLIPQYVRERVADWQGLNLLILLLHAEGRLPDIDAKPIL